MSRRKRSGRLGDVLVELRKLRALEQAIAGVVSCGGTRNDGACPGATEHQNRLETEYYQKRAAQAAPL